MILKHKESGKSFHAEIIEIDELGNIIVKYNKRIIQHLADEIVITHKFKTQVERFDQHGDLVFVKASRTATLKTVAFGELAFFYTANGFTHRINPDEHGHFSFPRKSPRA